MKSSDLRASSVFLPASSRHTETVRISPATDDTFLLPVDLSCKLSSHRYFHHPVPLENGGSR